MTKNHYTKYVSKKLKIKKKQKKLSLVQIWLKGHKYGASSENQTHYSVAMDLQD